MVSGTLCATSFFDVRYSVGFAVGEDDQYQKGRKGFKGVFRASEASGPLLKRR